MQSGQCKYLWRHINKNIHITVNTIITACNRPEET